jgi:hypothetical protein
MATDGSCSFSLLPKDASEALLLQAWQQLDQHHRFGIIPRVCSSWYNLSLPTFTSLKLALRDEVSTQQFAAWLRRHGSILHHLSVNTMQLTEPSTHLLSGVLGSMNSCKSLSSLHLLCWNGPTSLAEQLLTHLTSLTMRCRGKVALDYGQFYRNDRPQLRALDLHGSKYYAFLGEAEVHRLLSALPNLTSLDLRHTLIPLTHLASCPSLPFLEDLKLSITGGSDLQIALSALAVLPCSCLYVALWGDDKMQQFKTWSAGQQGKNCLGRITSMHWYLRGLVPPQPLSHAALSCLAEAAGQLKHLDLTGSNNASVKDLALLTGLAQLTSLSFTYAGSPDADADADADAGHTLGRAVQVAAADSGWAV